MCEAKELASSELCCMLLGDLAHVCMHKRLHAFGLCFV